MINRTQIALMDADLIDMFKHTELTDQIINAFYHVYNTLGYGFLEKICENALLLLDYLRATGVEVGLVLNFGPKPEIARRANSPDGQKIKKLPRKISENQA